MNYVIERDREVGNPLISLLLTGLFSHGHSALCWAEYLIEHLEAKKHMRNDLLEFRIMLLYKFMRVIIDDHKLNVVKKCYYWSGGGVGVNENGYLSFSVTAQHSKNRLFICTIKDSEFCMKETCYIDDSSVYHVWLIIAFTWKIIIYYKRLSGVNMKWIYIEIIRWTSMETESN